MNTPTIQNTKTADNTEKKPKVLSTQEREAALNEIKTNMIELRELLGLLIHQ